jgi:ABC-type multidrug transport system ATPase subunit
MAVNPTDQSSEKRPGTSIHTNGLAKRFNREWIFRKLSFEFKAGNTYGVTGPNGSGKSTLLQVLWGQSPPSAGTLSYTCHGNATLPEEIYRRISVATPYMDLIEEFTLQEQVAFHQKLKPFRDEITVEELISLMGLQNARNKQIVNFSSGMRQRVKLALAFFTRSEIIFLDEPGTNLDKNAFKWYREQLEIIQNKYPSTLILIASNDPEEYATAQEIISILDFK